MWKNGMDIAWCPGCGDFAVLDAVNRILETSEVPRNHFLYVSGIGQAAKLPQYLQGRQRLQRPARARSARGARQRSSPTAT